MNADLNKQTLEKLKLDKEDAIQKNLKFEFDDLIEMFEERVKKDEEDEKNFLHNFPLITNKDYAQKFFDSFSNEPLKEPLRTSSRCRAFTLGYGQFKRYPKELKIKSTHGFKLPCCWSEETQYDRFVGSFVKVFDWSKPSSPEEKLYAESIRHFYLKAEKWSESLFLKNYPLYDVWKDILNEKYKDIIKDYYDIADGTSDGEWCLFPSDCASCS
jgi:hypothetical protein